VKNDSAERIAELASGKGLRVAVAESLTSGQLAGALGAASGASEWFSGGVVAYSSSVKFDVLHVEPGPVVSARCAAQMAEGVIRLLAADVAVAVTGAGGPDPQDDQPPGTVFISVRNPEGDSTTEHHFEGDPEQVVQQTVETALELLERSFD
jgi:nicotinamide-nucleotide amidase